jgi:carbonic anhydrase
MELNTPQTPDEALERLLAGNRRFIGQETLHPYSGFERVQELAEQQQPFAILLCCADSRVAPEILFDQGLGDLFVARIAGNYVDDGILGSIEYAIQYCDARLIMVLGHERCGAIQATVRAVFEGKKFTGHIANLVEAIAPAVESTRDLPGDHVENAIRANVLRNIAMICESEPLLKPLILQGSLKVVGGRYDLDTGEVTLFTEEK